MSNKSLGGSCEVVQRWTVEDLNPDFLFEVTYNRDIETSARFSWPIPNMLNADGEPLVLHPCIAPKTEKDGSIFIDPSTGRKDYRFYFKNHKDNTAQGVKIDGTGCILFMSPSESKSKKIKEIIRSLGANIEGCSPQSIEDALEQIYLATGIGDRWNETKKTLGAKYDAFEDVEDQYFGRFLYKDEISSAVYLGGEGLFDGPAESDQLFHGGTFIIFPGKTIEDTRNIIAKYVPERKKETSGGAKHVAYDVFLTTRRLPDGTPIVPGLLKRQDEPNRRYYKPTASAGFSDYSPEIEAVERQWIAKIQGVFELYGYPRIKTKAVEELHVLRLEEGDRKPSQIFAIQKSFSGAASGNGTKEELYGLRYDHTVPLARYMAENSGSPAIILPFKTARIGPVWRNQEITRGQYREFIQADIDVVGDGYVPIEYDAEFPRIMCDVANELGIGSIELGISNRKITKGFFSSLGFDDELTEKIIRVIEKRDILGWQGIQAQLYSLFKTDKVLATRCLDFAMIKSSTSSFADEVLRLAKPNKLLEDGIEELMLVMDRLQDIQTGTVQADMSVVRDMNYYTGTVYEGRCKDSPTYPPIIVGGRYDNLVGHFMKESRPGVGASFEVTRAIDLMRDSKRLPLMSGTRTKALIVYNSNAYAMHAEMIAHNLRATGSSIEIAYGAGSLEDKLHYARAKNIPNVAIITDVGQLEVINMADMARRLVLSNDWVPK
ncbi:MAG: hypothetical protein A3B66_07265 [Alphaproteobacteria bacterium RIFCSPHIGHO2_02_FULL_46_13]|nr:MAG: hypothetical protein A3B66_07265 [Alphaproteobacteria bacterium RIFCSPHIGHO2_02_FULL_46_13]